MQRRQFLIGGAVTVFGGSTCLCLAADSAYRGCTISGVAARELVGIASLSTNAMTQLCVVNKSGNRDFDKSLAETLSFLTDLFNVLPAFSYFKNNSGYTGYTGATGATGYTGAVGATGYTGFTGSTGYTGYTGPAPTVSGPTGAIQFTNGSGSLIYDASFTFINTPSQLATGTITITNDSPIVTGTGTLFTSQLKVGEPLTTNPGNVTVGNIYDISGNTYLTLDASASLATQDASFNTSNYNVLNLDGDFLPTTTNKYSLGTTNQKWRELYVGPGTINLVGINGSSTLGLDNNNLAYFKTGLSLPSINVGPAINVQGAVGGWRIDASGNPSSSTYDLVARQNTTALPYGQTGPAYSLLRPLIPSGFTGSGDLSANIGIYAGTDASGGTLIASSSITINQTSYLWSTATMTFENSATANNYRLSAYMILNGTTSNVTTSTISERLASGVNGSTSITVQQRTELMIAPATYTSAVYAYVNDGTDVVLKHVDLFIMGNLG